MGFLEGNPDGRRFLWRLHPLRPLRGSRPQNPPLNLLLVAPVPVGSHTKGGRGRASLDGSISVTLLPPPLPFPLQMLLYLTVTAYRSGLLPYYNYYRGSQALLLTGFNHVDRTKGTPSSHKRCCWETPKTFHRKVSPPISAQRFNTTRKPFAISPSYL